MNNALLYIGGLLILVLSALFAVPYFVDWNSYRGVFEEEATRVLGRDVRVGGNVNLRLLPSPYVSFEKLKIADVGTTSRESVFRADGFTMWLSIPPLLKGVVEARKIELKRPMLRLVSDAEGGGNWQTLTIVSGELPFVPKDVALQSVTLVDGIISFGGPHQPELAAIEDIDGELSADTLTGPYKFVGKLAWNGKPRDVRLSTAAQDANGDIRFKTAVKALDTLNSYVLSGKFADIKGKPKLDGELTALLHIGLGGSEAAANGKADGTTGDVSPPIPTPQAAAEDNIVPDRPTLLPGEAATAGAIFELKSKVTGDVNGVALDDLTLSLEHDGPPQLITGAARISWPDRLKTELTLSSRWIDLDKVVGRDGKAVPLTAARDLFDALGRALPETADTEARLTLDQVTLGGEGLSGVEVSAARSGGPLAIRGIRAGLPGGARFDLDGVLTGPTTDRTFDGYVSLAGPSLARLLSWGFQGAAVLPGRAEGAFSLDGQLKLKARQVDIGEATAEIAGLPLKGGLSLTLGDRRTIAVEIDGHRIDVGNLWPGALAPERLTALVRRPANTADAGTPSPAGETATGEAAPDTPPLLTGVDWKMRLRAAEITDGDRLLKDVDADVALTGGKLSMRVLRFATKTGVAVDLEGEAKDVASDASGTIRGTVEVPTPEAVTALGTFVGLGGDGGLELARFGDLAPMRLAGTLETGKRLPTSSDLNLDGSSNGGRLVARALLDAGWSTWRNGPADIAISLDQPNAARIAEAMVGIAPMSQPLPGTEAARLAVKTAGTAASGMLVSAELASPTQSVAYDGRMILPAAGPARLEGKLIARNGEVRSLLALAGVPLAPGVQARLQGSVSVEAGDGRTVLTPDDLVVGGSKVNGRVTITAAKDTTPRRLEADLDVDLASVPGLLTVLLERQEAAPVVPPAPEPASRTTDGKTRRARETTHPASSPVLDTAASIWPAQSFDAAMARDLEASLTARFGTLSLEPGLAMSNAVLRVTSAPGRLAVDSLEAEGVGGRITSKFAIEKGAAGASLDGSLEIKVPGTNAPDSARQSATGDAASFRLAFSGRGLSPAGLMSVLHGEGEIKLADATLNGNSPKAVAEVSEAALTGKGANSGDELADSLKAALKAGALPLGTVNLPLKLSDGTLRLDNLAIETPDGRATLKAVVEVSTLRLDSEWQIEPRITREMPATPAAAATAAAAPASAAGAGTGVPTPAAPIAALPPATERVLLPALTVTYVGKLRDYSSLEPIVATAALERELSVRKMEREVDLLERLRRQDEARAKADFERQKALEAERTRQLENLSAPWPMPAAPTAGETDASTGAPTPGEPVAATVDATGTSAAGAPAADPDAVEPPRAASRPRPVKKRPADNWQPFQIQPF